MNDSANMFKNCLMDYDQASLVLNMLEKSELFSEIGIDVKYDFETLAPHTNSEGKVMVVFEIPRHVDMPMFFREFCSALNPESAALKSKERNS